MQPYTEHEGLVATLDRMNVDTDQIIPKQFLKRIERSGFGPYLFYDWRHLPDGSLNPKFELNQPRYAGATILLTRANFGCGSSREHAPWALLDAGFRTLIAPSFSDIFYNNCIQNGILPVRLPEAQVDSLFEKARGASSYRLLVNLRSCRISDNSGFEIVFEIDPFRRECLLRGLDDIALSLACEERIREYECFRRHYE